MPTSYTSLIGLALPVTGELSGTWGDTVNNYITNYLDSAVAGTQTISGSQTAVTLSVTNGSSLVTAGSGATGSAQFQIINCTGNPAGLLTITAPASSRQYIIINATSTSQSVKIVGTGPTTGVTILSGEKAHVAWNGSDFVKIATQSGNGSFVDLTVSGSMTLSGGTANGVLYLNGSKVATSGSALTFNGTQLGVTNGAGSAIFKLDGTSAPEIDFYASGAIKSYIYAPSTSLQLNTVGSNPIIFLPNEVEGMRLTSTGLGIGTSSPSNKLTVAGNINTTGAGYIRSVGTGSGSAGVGPNIGVTDNGYYWIQQLNASSGYDTWFYNGSWNLRTTLDSSGNLGLGVTPSAWRSTWKAFQISNRSLAQTGAGAGDLTMVFNGYFDSTDSRWEFQGAGDYAARYSITGAGVHSWHISTAAGANANDPISFTQAMTLDASGNLQLGTTTNKTTAWSGNGTGMTIGGALAPTIAVWDTSNSSYVGSMTQVDADLYFTNTANGVMVFNTNNTERARITSGGNLLVGTTSISGTSSDDRIIGIYGAGVSNRAQLRLTNSNSGTAGSDGTALSLDSSLSFYITQYENASIVFETNGANERARITSGGAFCVGTTATDSGAKMRVSYGASENGIAIQDTNNTNNTSFVIFQNSTPANIGSITRNGTTNAVLYNTTSDQRLKQNIQDADDAAALIDSIKVRKYDWKSGGSHQRYGFVAQELVTVAPEAVHQPNNPEEMMAVDYSKLVPMLVKEIQSLRARVAALESKGV